MNSTVVKKQQEVIDELRLSNDLKDKKIMELEILIKKQLILIEEQKFRIDYLELQKAIAANEKYGKKSDSAFDDSKIITLFNFDNEVEENADPSVEEPKKEEPEEEYEDIQYRRKRRKNLNNRDVIPTVVINHDLPDEALICPLCGSKLIKIGEDVFMELYFRPSEYKYIEHRYPKYKCINECNTKFDTLNVISTLEQRPFAKSMANETVVSHIIVEKFCKYVPLYRQEKFFNNIGVDISRQTLSNWVMSAGEYIKVIVDQMHKDLIKNDIIMMDETTTRVLDSKNTQAYIWLATSSKYDIPINLYLYKNTREHHHAEDIIKGGNVKYVQSDLYGAYGKLNNAIDVGCWAHVKRKFTEIYKVTQKNTKYTYMNENLEHAIKVVRELYRIERKLSERNASFEEISETRQKVALPKINEFYQWCLDNVEYCRKGSELYKALYYVINNIEILRNYTLDGRLSIDNNKAERTAKTYKRGLANWLFNITSNGADTSCAILSLVSTAVENGLNVYEYLVYLFRGMAKYLNKLNNLNSDDINEIRKLLPYSPELPDSIRVKNKKSS